MAYATAHGILCSLENPMRSHMWNTTHVRNELQPVADELQVVLFHHCMFGDKRKKRTKLFVNHSCFNHLKRDCDQSHVHERWAYAQWVGYSTGG